MPKRCWNLYSVAKAGAAPRGQGGQGGQGSSAGLNVAQSHGPKLAKLKIR